MLRSEFKPYGRPGAQDLKACHHPALGNKKPLSSGSQLISPAPLQSFPRLSTSALPLERPQLPIPTPDKNQALNTGSLFFLTA